MYLKRSEFAAHHHPPRPVPGVPPSILWWAAAMGAFWAVTFIAVWQAWGA